MHRHAPRPAGGRSLAPQPPGDPELAHRSPAAPAALGPAPQPPNAGHQAPHSQVLMRPLCPAPVISPVRALDHMLVAPEVPALQPRLLAPVDLPHHLLDLVLGDLLLHPHDVDETPSPPDDGWAAGKGTFFVVASVSLTRMARESGYVTFSGAFLVPTLAATRHWRCLPPGLKLPCQPTWNRFSSRRNTSQADVSVKSGPDYQTFSSLASIKSCLVTQDNHYPYFIL